MTDNPRDFLDDPECVTLKRVQETVQSIRAFAADGRDAAAAALEAALHAVVLQAVGRRIIVDVVAARCAALAAETLALDFKR